MSARGQWDHSPLGHRPLPRGCSGTSPLLLRPLGAAGPSPGAVPSLSPWPRASLGPAGIGAAQLVGGGEESWAEAARQGPPTPTKTSMSLVGAVKPSGRGVRPLYLFYWGSDLGGPRDSLQPGVLQ